VCGVVRRVVRGFDAFRRDPLAIVFGEVLRVVYVVRYVVRLEQVFVDGLRRDLPVPEGEEGVPSRLPSGSAPLLLSSPEPGLCFRGGIDEVRLDGIASEAEFEVPAGVLLEGPPRVRFDVRGELDPLLFDGPVTFTIKLEGTGAEAVEGSRDAPRTVSVTLAGNQCTRRASTWKTSSKHWKPFAPIDTSNVEGEVLPPATSPDVKCRTGAPPIARSSSSTCIAGTGPETAR